MRILLSAYACAPGQGSEPEVGYQAMLGAASRHEVWVLSQRHTLEMVQRSLSELPAGDRIHLEAIDPPAAPQRGGLRAQAAIQWRHGQWQRHAALRGLALDRKVNFDVVHHVTLASYWMRTGVAAVNKPLVWGPVGGAVEPPWRLLGELGWSGLAEEAVRTSARRVASRLPSIRLPQRKAAVILVQNPETASRIEAAGDIARLPNALVVDLKTMPAVGSRTKDVLFIGRLAPWKAARLAVRTMRHLRHEGATLRIYGDGAERQRILDAARQWGIQDRVRLEGMVTRKRLLEQLARAGALLHPSLHEEGGTAVAEALALGTPVICLQHGGPVELLRWWPDSPAVTVRPGWPEATARSLAAAIDRFLAAPPPVPSVPVRPRASFTEALLSAYEDAVNASRRVAR